MKIVFRKNGQVLCDSVLIGHCRPTLASKTLKPKSWEFCPWDAREGFCYRVENKKHALRERIKNDAALLQENRK